MSACPNCGQQGSQTDIYCSGCGKRRVADLPHSTENKPVTADVILGWLLFGVMLSFLVGSFGLSRYRLTWFLPAVILGMPMKGYSWKGRPFGFRFMYFVFLIIALFICAKFQSGEWGFESFEDWFYTH